jgi:hypothetical protein
MTVEDQEVEHSRRMRLRVTSEADPGALPRVLAHFQNLNIVPDRVVAELATTNLMHICIDLRGLPAARLAIITGKISQTVSVTNAYWHDL